MEKINQSKILFTGGSGRLGREVRKLLPKALYPGSDVFDITNPGKMLKFAEKHKPKLIIHAAALARPEEAEKNPKAALLLNIIGTANVAALCLAKNLKMVYISTDYVFKGDRGNYAEEDAVLPSNKYAWSKLGGECAVKLLENYLIIRTSFGPKIFPYPKAFIDHYTSRENADEVARKIVKAVRAGISGTLHIGHSRRSVYAYARTTLSGKKNIGKTSIKLIGYKIPKDTSLNLKKFQKLFSGK